MIVSDVITAEVLSRRAVGTGALYIHLPLSPKPIEVVYEVSAHERLDRLVEVRD